LNHIGRIVKVKRRCGTGVGKRKTDLIPERIPETGRIPGGILYSLRKNGDYSS